MSRAAFIVLALAAAVHAATILELAQATPSLSTLVAVSGAAGIAPLLNAAGVKTVFAPSNDAFAKLGNNTLAWITNSHNQQHLLATLYYHITSGAITSGLLQPRQIVPTLDQAEVGAETVTIIKDGATVNVNNAVVTTADVAASNGVVHIINGVLVPRNIGLPAKDIVQTAIAAPVLSTLVEAVKAAGLAAALSQPNGPFVVFAPTDTAFEAVPARVLQCLLTNVQALQNVLLFHVVSGLVYSEQIASGTSVPTLAGKPITLNIVGGGVQVNYGARFTPANVVIPNIDTSNGVVHVIDKVLFDGTGPCAFSA